MSQYFFTTPDIGIPYPALPKMMTLEATTSNGIATFYLTDDATVNGTILFTDVFGLYPAAQRDTTNAVECPLPSIKSISQDFKTVEVNVVTGKTINALGDTVEKAPDGTKVYLLVVAK
jgi:hypothetical protein